MLRKIKDPNLFLLFGSLGLWLFSTIGYWIYTTVLPSSHELMDTIHVHASMHELVIAHGHNCQNHNESEHIHWDI